MNKNFNNNDHESFIEGIFGCMERLEAGIIELQKSKPSDSNSVVDNEANETLVEEIKALVTNAKHHRISIDEPHTLITFV